MLCFKMNIIRRVLSLTHDLHLDALSSDVIEYKLRSRRSFGVHPARDADLCILFMFAGLDRRVLLEKVSEITIGLKLVWIRVWVLAISQSLDAIASNLEILLSNVNRVEA